MTVAYDAKTQLSATTPGPVSGTHTPVGTPRSVVLFANTPLADTVTATYGGVAMTAVADAHDTAGEPMHIYAFHLGASIPTGAQTVSVTFGGAACRVLVATSTAGANTEVGASGVVQGDTANPSVALDTGATESLRYVGIVSGTSDPASLVLLSGMSDVDNFDAGAEVRKWSRQTTASTGSFTIGYTIGSDDVAMVALAIQEIAGGATVDPYPYIGGGYYPTEG